MKKNITILDAINSGDIEKATEMLLEAQASESESESSEESSTTTSCQVEETKQEQEQELENSSEESSSQGKTKDPTKNNQKQKTEAESQEQEPKADSQKQEPKEPEMQEYIKPTYYQTAKACVENNVPVLLVGEAGTGKNELCKNLAHELGLNFYFANAINDTVLLTGYGDARGQYIQTQFYDFCKNGGLFMFDEIDASDPQALVYFNSAIANRYFDFPVVGRVYLNKNCRFIACANTTGQGASIRYVGRNQLDAATLDRFAVLQTDYDKKVETAMAKGDSELVHFIEAFRDSARRQGVDIVVSYRAISRIVALSKAINDTKKLIEMCLTRGLEKEDIKSLVQGMTVDSNKYTIALAKLGGVM